MGVVYIILIFVGFIIGFCAKEWRTVRKARRHYEQNLPPANPTEEYVYGLIKEDEEREKKM